MIGEITIWASLPKPIAPLTWHPCGPLPSRNPQPKQVKLISGQELVPGSHRQGSSPAAAPEGGRNRTSQGSGAGLHVGRDGDTTCLRLTVQHNCPEGAGQSQWGLGDPHKFVQCCIGFPSPQGHSGLWGRQESEVTYPAHKPPHTPALASTGPRCLSLTRTQAEGSKSPATSSGRSSWCPRCLCPPLGVCSHTTSASGHWGPFAPPLLSLPIGLLMFVWECSCHLEPPLQIFPLFHFGSQQAPVFPISVNKN